MDALNREGKHGDGDQGENRDASDRLPSLPAASGQLEVAGPAKVKKGGRQKRERQNPQHQEQEYAGDMRGSTAEILRQAATPFDSLQPFRPGQFNVPDSDLRSTPHASGF